MQRLHADLEAASSPFYSINLDPAVANLPYEPDIDVRQTVDYKGVMKQYTLGPNGAILTALNLFATKFDQVLSLVEKRAASAEPPRHVLVDTPGQIEIFTWSASGAVIAESLASALPTCILYVIDTPRSARPVTFMSNMLYACSILYKFRLPLLLVFNKTDVLAADFAADWMADCEAFQAALEQEKAYIGSLSRSMALMLDEFYSQLRTVAVSALTGDGVPALLEALDGCADEYAATYAVDLATRRATRDAERLAAAQEGAARLVSDLENDRIAAEAAAAGESDRASGGGAGTGADAGGAAGKARVAPAAPRARAPRAVADVPDAVGGGRLGPTLSAHGTRAADRDADAEGAEADGDGPVYADLPNGDEGGDEASEEAELQSFRTYLQKQQAEQQARGPA
jgi:hypothetical protein